MRPCYLPAGGQGRPEARPIALTAGIDTEPRVRTLETISHLSSRMRNDAAPISDSDLAEVRRMAAEGRRIPDIVLKAIARRIEADEAARLAQASARNALAFDPLRPRI